MPCEIHVGHDHDTDCDPECVVCGEVVHDAEHHTCQRPQGADQ